MTLPTLMGPVGLRPWADDDVESLATEIQDPEIVRWLDIELPYTLGDASAFVEAAAGRWERREAAHFVITRDRAFAGYLGVLAVDAGMRSVEIVYWVASRLRGQGVASAAVRLALEWIAAEVRPERVELGMVLGNTASERVASANGFVRSLIRPGAARLDGQPADELVMVWAGP